MDLIAMLQGLIEKLSLLQMQLNEAQMKAGEAQMQIQIEKDAAFQAGKAEAQAEIDALKAEIEELKKNPPPEGDLIFSQADMDAAVAAAIAQLKAEILAKYKEAQDAEGALEKSIEDLLA